MMNVGSYWGRRGLIPITIVTILDLVISLNSTAASELREWKTVPDIDRFHTSTCGVYAVAAAARYYGKEFELRDMLGARYVPSSEGSSGNDLVHAARDLGLSATPIQNITWAFLESCDSPVIIHLERNPKQTGHWVTFLGYQDGKALIFDQARDSKWAQVSPGDLLSEMTGFGIVVALETTDQILVRPILSSLAQFSGLIVVAGVGGWLALGTRTRGLIGLFVSAISVSVAYQLADAGAIRQNPDVASWIGMEYVASVKLPEIGFDEFIKRYKADAAYFVDARPRGSFRALHLKGSINLPIGVQSNDFFELVGQSNRTRLCVVYCASRQCDWGEKIGQRLKRAGFNQVFVFRGGIESLVLQKVPMEQGLQ